MVFSLFKMSAHIRLRQRITKKDVFFSIASAQWVVAEFQKKTIHYKKYKKHWSDYIFHFFIALIHFFEND